MSDRFEDKFHQKEAKKRENPHWRVKLIAETEVCIGKTEGEWRRSQNEYMRSTMLIASSLAPPSIIQCINVLASQVQLVIQVCFGAVSVEKKQMIVGCFTV